MFKLREILGKAIYGICDFFVMIWGNISQAYEEIREIVLRDQFTRDIVEVLGFLISPRKIIARIFRFNAGELLLFLIGWGMLFSWGVITLIQHVSQSLGLVVLPLGPIMYFIGTGGIMTMSVAFGKQAERFTEKVTEKAEKRRQNYAEFLEKYPQTN